MDLTCFIALFFDHGLVSLHCFYNILIPWYLDFLHLKKKDDIFNLDGLCTSFLEIFLRFTRAKEMAQHLIAHTVLPEDPSLVP